MREGLEVVDQLKRFPRLGSSSVTCQKSSEEGKKKEIIMSIFDHTSEALAHLLMTAVHFSSLAKITDTETLHLVMNAAIWSLVQLNLPEKFLNLVADPVPMMMEEQRRAKVERTIVPRHDVACMKHKLKNGTNTNPCCSSVVETEEKILQSGYYQGGVQTV